jgi:hypothetical protein
MCAGAHQTGDAIMLHKVVTLPAAIAAIGTRLQFESDDRLILAIAFAAVITFIASVLGLFWLP